MQFYAQVHKDDIPMKEHLISDEKNSSPDTKMATISANNKILNDIPANCELRDVGF